MKESLIHSWSSSWAFDLACPQLRQQLCRPRRSKWSILTSAFSFSVDFSLFFRFCFKLLPKSSICENLSRLELKSGAEKRCWAHNGVFRCWDELEQQFSTKRAKWRFFSIQENSGGARAHCAYMKVQALRPGGAVARADRSRWRLTRTRPFFRAKRRIRKFLFDKIEDKR